MIRARWLNRQNRAGFASVGHETQLLHDRPVETLIVATKTSDPGPFLDPPVDLTAVVG